MKRRSQRGPVSNSVMTNVLIRNSGPVLSQVLSNGRETHEGCVVAVDYSGERGRAFVLAAARANGVSSEGVGQQMDASLASNDGEPPLHVHWYWWPQLVKLLVEVFGENESDLKKTFGIRATGRARLVAINEKGFRTWDAIYEATTTSRK